MRAEANLHMVPARFDLDQPAAKHRCRHTCRQTHTHTHTLCGVRWKNVTEEATLQACSGLDSVLHSDRKHHSYICVLSLSYVPPLIYPVAVIFLLYCLFVLRHNLYKIALEQKTNGCCLQQHSTKCDNLLPPCRTSGWFSAASALPQKCHGYRVYHCSNLAEVHQKYIGHGTPGEA